MTAAKHTPGPWYVAAEDLSGGRYYSISSQNCDFFIHDGAHEEENGEANAARIVACVNACEGIADPAVVPELLAFVADFIAVMNRDGFTGDEPDRLHKEATAIIAKATGGAA